MGFSAGRPPKVFCQLARTANQPIPNGTLTTVTYDAEPFDSYGFHAPGSGDAVIPSAGVAGFYAITFNALWEDQGLTGYWSAQLVYENAAGTINAPIAWDGDAVGAQPERIQLAMTPGFQLQQNDKIRVQVLHSFGATVPLLRSGDYSPALHMVRVA